MEENPPIISLGMSRVEFQFISSSLCDNSVFINTKKMKNDLKSAAPVSDNIKLIVISHGSVQVINEN